MYGNQVLFSITDRDALWENINRDSLAQQRKQIVVNKLQEMKEEYGLLRMLKRIAYFILVVVGQTMVVVCIYQLGIPKTTRPNRSPERHTSETVHVTKL